MSTNRTFVDLVSAEAIAGAEGPDLLLHLSLPGGEPIELDLPLRQPAQVLADQGADRTAALGGPDPGVSVDLVWHGNSDVLHTFTVSQLHSYTVTHGCASLAKQPAADI